MLFLFLVFQIWLFGSMTTFLLAQTERGRYLVVMTAFFVGVAGVAAAMADRETLRSAIGYLR